MSLSWKMPTRWPCGSEPVEGEAAPGQGREVRVVEGQDAGDRQRQEEKEEEEDDKGGEGQVIGPRARQGADHRATSPRRWPLSLRPHQMIVELSSSSKKPKAAPWFQLKLAMNWL